MTTYSFKPNASTTSVNWHDPSVWAGGVVPNAPDADVDFPIVTETGTGETYTSFVSILSGESYAIRSLTLRDYLSVYGSLAVNGTLAQSDAGEIDMHGGTLTAGALTNDAYDIQGSGQVTVGTLTNDTLIVGDGLTVTAATLVNNGTLGGNMTVEIGAGGLTGLANGTLSRGTLEGLQGDALVLHAGSVITTDAAAITLSGGTITSRDPATGQDVVLTSSLHAVAAGGTLTVTSGAYHFGQLTVAGTLALSDAAQFTADQLVIAQSGHLTGSGTLTSPVENDGIIQAGRYIYDAVAGYGSTLVLDGAVTGSGSIEILPGHGSIQIHVGYVYSGPTLEIAGPTAQNVVFDDAYGILRLDRPASFTGTIATTGNGDAIILAGISLASITGKSYSGDGTGGTLTLQEGATSLAYHFAGSHTLGDFAVSAGPQGLSSDPPSLLITVTGSSDFALTDFRLPTAVQLSGSTVPVTFGVGLGFTDSSQSVLEAYITLDRPLNIAAQPLTYAIPHGTPIIFGGPYQTLSPYIYYTGQGGADTPQLLGLTETVAGGSYSGTLPLGAITKAGSYHVVSLTVEDQAGQTQTYTAQQLAAQGFATSFTVTGGGPPSDFDGDARSDILWQNVNGAVSSWHATGSGASDGIVKDTFDAQVATSWHAVDSFDFNGDGRADILWRNADGTLAVWDGTATGFNQSSYIERPPATSVIVATGDFDGDGNGDVLFRGSDGSLTAERSTGTSLQYGYSHASVGTVWKVEGAADFTGDGKADILWRNADGSLSTWDATGSPTGGISLQENSWFHAPIAASWHVVGLGDFNGDGRADILWRNDNGAVSVWTFTGAGGFAENQFGATAAANWSVAEVGDFNGDGMADILWRNTTGQISIWHSTGSGWAQNTYFDGTVGTDWTIAAHQFPL